MGSRSQFAIFLVIQLLSLLLWLALLSNTHLPPIWSLVLPSVLAACCAWRFQDGKWWLVIHAVFLPLALILLSLQINPLYYLSAFIVSWLIFGHVVHSRVPLYLSNTKALAELAKIVPQGVRFLDIGAGTGTVLAYLAKHRPDLQLAGVELAWLPWFVGRLRLPAHIKWQRRNYNQLDFSHYDVIYAFLSPTPMPALWEKVSAQMPVGGLFISNTFSVPEVEADQLIVFNDWKGGKLLLWHM